MATATVMVGFDTFVRDLSMTRLSEIGGTYVLSALRVTREVDKEEKIVAVAHARVVDADTGEWVGDLHSRGIYVVRDFETVLAGGYDGGNVGPVKVVKVGNAFRFQPA